MLTLHMLKIHHNNATKFQEEYQRQRTQLEENYESYRHIFESQSSSAAAADRDVDEEDGGLNPFDDATEDEIASIESVLDTLEPSGGVMANESQIHTSTGEDAEELERQTIRVGSADFDEGG